MNDREAERVIARWLGILEPNPHEADSLEGCVVVADEEMRIFRGLWAEPWSPSTDVNLWFGEDGIFARMLPFKDAFMRLGPWFIEEIPAIGEWLLLTAGSKGWTHALAAAIKEGDTRT